ncbi:DUF916 and DUF3324 domain-containing protein [Erysipelothrix anatis]|uniref:DUF916 and DUF3324 domain-containing protein n=1 Tax=Erysipelothrix anatis TaxID=2683713 RepID=UPI00140A1286|nr:DUF916 and DUF3324 domain-containing protein [Erysipelothrix anatis]
MKKNKTIMAMILTMLIMVTQINIVRADAYDKFSINPIIPENQINQNVGYFDLDLKPNTKQTLTIEIINQGDEPMNATVSLVDATTNNNAMKQFSTVKAPDASLSTPLTSFATLREEQIEVAPHATENIYIDIDTTDVDFEGIRLGGITVIADTLNNKDTSNASGVTLNNRVAYTLGLQTRMHDTPIKSNLNYVKTDIDVIDLDAHFVSVIQNDQPVLMNGVSLHGSISDTKTGKVVGMVDKKNGSIAPNTNFNVVYTGDRQTIDAGTYAIDLEIKHESDVWHFKDTFTVSEDASASINDDVVSFEQNANILTWILLGIMAVMLMIIFFLLWKRHNDKENQTSH